MGYLQNNSIFWIEVDKVQPNPYQPRRDFDESKLKDLAESIKMYGILQPLTVTRQEVETEDGGLKTVYELIAGERRLRASKLAGLVQVPVIIRSGDDDDKVKLELAIIENLQRDDLNPVERAQAFQQLAEQFGFKHSEIAKRVGKSREYISNTIRLLSLPEEVLNALSAGKISEGHTRPILMLKDKPQEQLTLYKEVMFKKLTVRESEAIARRIAYDKVRKQSRSFDPTLVEMEDKLAESLGTRVFIEKRPVGGKIMIDFFSNDDLQKILDLLQKEQANLTSVSDMENSLKNEESNQESEDFIKSVAEVGDDSVSDVSDDLDKGIDNTGSSADSNVTLNVTIPSYDVEEEIVEGSTEEPNSNGFRKISVTSYAPPNDDSLNTDEDEGHYSVGDFTI